MKKCIQFKIVSAGLMIALILVSYYFHNKKTYPVIVTSGHPPIDVNTIKPEIESKQATAESYLKMYYYEKYVSKDDVKSEYWYEKYEDKINTNK